MRAANGGDSRHKGATRYSINQPCFGWLIYAKEYLKRYVALVNFDRSTTILQGCALPNGTLPPDGLGMVKELRCLVFRVRTAAGGHGVEFARKWLRTIHRLNGSELSLEVSCILRYTLSLAAHYV